MPRTTLIRFITTVSLLLAACVAGAADAPGTLGLGMAVDGEGFFLNPTLKSATVSSLAPNGPAALAGIHIGDLILEVDGKVIAGAKANDLKPLLRRPAGQPVVLKLRRPGGPDYGVSLITVAKD